jgi:hypothetical protein
MDLTDKQRALIEPLFETKRRADGRGRPWRDSRGVLNGVLWTMKRRRFRPRGQPGSAWIVRRFSSLRTCNKTANRHCRCARADY